MQASSAAYIYGPFEKVQPPNALPSARRRRARGAHGETLRRVRPIIGRVGACRRPHSEDDER
eukprot:5665028-Pyramimonas_sp.AAC.1